MKNKPKFASGEHSERMFVTVKIVNRATLMGVALIMFAVSRDNEGLPGSYAGSRWLWTTKCKRRRGTVPAPAIAYRLAYAGQTQARGATQLKCRMVDCAVVASSFRTTRRDHAERGVVLQARLHLLT